MKHYIIYLLFLTLVGCGVNGKHQQFDQTGLKLSTLGYVEDIKPLFENRCALCHNGGSTIPNWLDYGTAKNSAAEIKRRVFEVPQNHADSMPKKNATAMEQIERALVAQWVDLGAPEFRSGTTGGGDPDPDPDPKPEITLEFLQENLFTKNNRCTMCHQGLSAPQGLRFDTIERTRLSLLGANGEEEFSKEKPEVKRVTPGDSSPEVSYIIAKVIENDEFRIGARMPAAGEHLNDEEITWLETWIQGLAPLEE